MKAVDEGLEEAVHERARQDGGKADDGPMGAPDGLVVEVQVLGLAAHIDDPEVAVYVRSGVRRWFATVVEA